jgi:hypothetical protein
MNEYEEEYFEVGTFEVFFGQKSSGDWINFCSVCRNLP